MTTIREHFGLDQVEPRTIRRPAGAGVNQFPMIASTEMIGIEVEVEGVYDIGELTTGAWTTTDDGSLRNSGREFITRPIKAEDAPFCLDELMAMSKRLNWSFTPRTSVHVHVNVHDMPTTKVVDFIMLYLLFEHHLFRFVGRNRIRNPYCVAITQTVLPTRVATKGWKAPWEKYGALNIVPYSSKGTFEFRHMHGTNDVAKLCNWIGLIVRLKEYVMQAETGAVRKMIAGLTVDDCPALMRAVFREFSDNLVVQSPEEFKVGLLQAKVCQYNIKYQQKLVSEVIPNSIFNEVK